MQIFREIGAELCITEEKLKHQAQNLEAFVFDWDGVFNAGTKGNGQVSGFSEVDSMGINMIRFAYWLRSGKIPFTAIVTGEQNPAATELAQREHFQAVYFRIKHKADALEHLQKNYSLDNEKIAFCFDDILDLSFAQKVGLRFLVKRKSNPLFLNYAKKHEICDYITACGGDEGAIREISEVLLWLTNAYEDTISQRVAYNETYQNYLEQRNSIKTEFYTQENKKIRTTIISSG
jgi:3-deoxy-D-manno-octulosonate 8-phosphate phosphatase (KDO 8-P phosphatase)